MSETWHERDPEVLNKMLVEINAKLESNPDDSDLLLEKSSCLRHMNKLEEALEIHQKLITKDPENLEYVFMMGIVLLESEKDQEAIKYFTILLKEKYKQRDAHFNLGLALQRLGKEKEAAKHLKKAMSF